MQHAHGGDRTHDGDVRVRPGEDAGRTEGPRVHGDVGAAVGLARDDGHAGHHALGEGVQQLGAAAYDAVPLLADAGQVAGHVDEDDERHPERVAHPHEARGLLRRGGVEATAEAQRVVGDDADGATAEAAERRRDVGGPARVQLEAGALVEHPLDERVHVVGALDRLGEQAREVDVGDLAELALGTEQRVMRRASSRAPRSVSATTWTTPERRPWVSGHPAGACRRPRR